MRKDRLAAAALATVLLAAPLRGQAGPAGGAFAPTSSRRPGTSSETLVSSSVAGRLREIAREMTRRADLSPARTDQAVILLTAARSLDRDAEEIEPLLLELVTRKAEKDYSDHVLLLLRSYVDGSADRAVVGNAIRYLLDRLNTREQRKEMLETLVAKIGNRNPAVDSELATLLGLIMLEKADFGAARFYLVQAYAENKYNKRAFARLAELAFDEIGPSAYLEHLRLVMRENPLDLDAALNFAQYAERLQLYAVACDSYQYCAELFRYLYPAKPLPPHIYLPWAVSSYNAPGRERVCLQIAAGVRDQGRFDILLEAVAGRAAARTGDAPEARRIFRQAEQWAGQLLEAGPRQDSPQTPTAMTAVRTLTPKQFAWFYCFADPTAEKALDWANKAYSAEPNAPAATALLAYALSMSEQLEWAKPLLASFEHNQIADLVQARIQQAEGKKADAIQTLRRAVAKDPGSLAAERAREMLGELGSPYMPPVDPATLMEILADSLGETVGPQFRAPDQTIDVQFSIRGNEFSYGEEVAGTAAILNQGREPLVVTENGLFTGRIRVDAHVSGDIQREIPNLLSRTVRTALTVPPDRSIVTSLPLTTGELRRILMTHPQAALEVKFTLYLDPVTGEDGTVRNRLADLEPAVVSIVRPGVELSARYVRSRFNAVSSTQAANKIQIARLFTGLLRERRAMTEHGDALYPYRHADWLADLLRSAFVSDSGLLLGSGEDEWVVKVHAMADLLTLPLDRELAAAIAGNLNHPQWPVRLMAVYLLANAQGPSFAKVLGWVARNDGNPLVRSMAMALGTDLPAAAHVQSVTPEAPIPAAR